MKKIIAALTLTISLSSFANPEACKMIDHMYTIESTGVGTNLNKIAIALGSDCMKALENIQKKGSHNRLIRRSCISDMSELRSQYVNQNLIQLMSVYLAARIEESKDLQISELTDSEITLKMFKNSIDILSTRSGAVSGHFREEVINILANLDVTYKSLGGNWDKLRKDFQFHLFYEKNLTKQYKDVLAKYKQSLEKECGLELRDPKGNSYKILLKSIEKKEKEIRLKQCRIDSHRTNS